MMQDLLRNELHELRQKIQNLRDIAELTRLRSTTTEQPD